MSVFAAAETVIHRDPNLSIAATYRAGGHGPGLPVRIVRSAASGIVSAMGRSMRVTEDGSISVLASDGRPERGDTWELDDGTILTATDTERSAEGASWTVTVR